MRKKNQRLPKEPVTTTIESFSHDGRGIARIKGKTTFIEGALPEETVTFAYTRCKNDFDEGRVLEILTPSENRVAPACPHYALCGGCSFQHVQPSQQIAMKQIALIDALERIGHCKPDQVLAPLSDKSWHYRTKARLSVRYVEKKETTLVGFRERYQPRYITEIETCLVLDERVATKIVRIREVLNNLDEPRCIAQIEVATADEEVALVLRHLQPLSEADLGKLCAFGAETGFKLFLQPEGPDSIHLLYPESGDSWLTYRLPDFNLMYQFHPTDFTQVNPGINRLMVNLAIKLLDISPNDVILDLFCGLGNFSLPMAKKCVKVLGIEGSQAMVKRASENARLNELTNTEFMSVNLEDTNAFLDSIKHQKFTKILLDPPRTGAFEVVQQMDKLNPQRIVYVSCNPVTLARDAGVLVNQHGYRLVAAGVMDMFPHTAHVESIALFEK